jgi:hypothetical protein
METLNQSTNNRSEFMFIGFFKLIPPVLEQFKHYDSGNSNCEKSKRYKYLKQVYNSGIDKYTKSILDLTPDFFDFGTPSFLIDFEKHSELSEWILSGLNKKSQDEFFDSKSTDESEEDTIDSP